MNYKSLPVLLLVLLGGCIFDSEKKPDTDRPLTVKFSNTGPLDITALFFKPLSDTANWGTSVLPVTKLRNNHYVWIHGLTLGKTYAFKALFDSAGHSIHLTYTEMHTGGADTVSAFSYLGTDGSWGHGHNWGLEFFENESLATEQ